MRRSPIDHSRLDRANVVAVTIMQILADRRLNSAEMRLRVAQYLRGEFDDLAAQVASEREVYDDV